MVVLSKVVVVEFDEAVNGLLHRAHLDQGHLVVLPVKERCLSLFSGEDCLQFITTDKENAEVESDLLKELEGFDCGS